MLLKNTDVPCIECGAAISNIRFLSGTLSSFHLSPDFTRHKIARWRIHGRGSISPRASVLLIRALLGKQHEIGVCFQLTVICFTPEEQKTMVAYSLKLSPSYVFFFRHERDCLLLHMLLLTPRCLQTLFRGGFKRPQHRLSTNVETNVETNVVTV